MPYTPTNIVSVPSGNFTPGAQATLEFSAAVINAAWNQANQKTDDFETKLAALMDDFLSATAVPHITGGTVADPSITEPAVNIPANQSASDVLSLFETKFNELVALLVQKFEGFQATYFPNDGQTYSAAESWLQSAMASANGGLPDTVVDQLYETARSKIVAEATRATEDVLATFATKRFPLPPGAAAGAVLEIQQKSQDQLAESARQLVTVTIEQIRWNIDHAIKMRETAMSSSIEYIKALASGHTMTGQLVGTGYDAQSKLISAASQFYNSRTAAAEALAKVREFNVTTAVGVAEKNQAADMQMIQNKLEALLMEAKALAQMATSMFNNLHAQAGTQYSVAA